MESIIIMKINIKSQFFFVKNKKSDKRLDKVHIFMYILIIRNFL